MHANRKPRVALSHGDINGIGYELLLKLFADERILELFTPIVYGSAEAERLWSAHLGLESKPSWRLIKHPSEASEGQVNLIDIAEGEAVALQIGEPTPLSGLLALRALETASSAVARGEAEVLVTLPINKSAMPRELFPYAGHTPYLEAHFAPEGGQSLMLLASPAVRVALVTEHIPLSQVSERLTRELIVSKAKALEAGLKKDFGIIKPRIAVLALNPHAGDRGLLGDEEERVITPAVRELEEEGMIAFGPYPADGFWGSETWGHFDAVLAMYHDQGLAPFKALYMGDGVNATLGLSIIRTSPDHGTGYDIAGQGKASDASLRSAIYLSIDMLRARRAYTEATRNPLRNTFNPRGREDGRIDSHSERPE